MEAIINFWRPGTGVTRYVEGLVDDSALRLKTQNDITANFSQKWCKDAWWKNGYI